MTMKFWGSKTEKAEKKIFLGGYELQFNEDEQWTRFLHTQVITEETSRFVGYALELIFVNEKLDKVYEIEDEDKWERKLSESEKELIYQQTIPHQLFEMINVKDSKSYLGGSVPEGLHLPESIADVPLLYLGKISKTEVPFLWLPFDLHLIAPIFLIFDRVFIDYSDPLNPLLLKREELQSAEKFYDSVSSNSEATYKKSPISFRRSKGFGEGIGHGGIPSWIQYPDIPTCPKSKKTMKFVCQIYHNLDIEVENSNILPTIDYEMGCFDKLNFWGDGDLFIFFDPESKIACYIIQMT